MRSTYYMAGIVLSSYFLSYLIGLHSTSQSHFSTLRWNNLVPLVVSLIGIVHSVAVWRTRPQSQEYVPQLDAEETLFRGEHSG